MDNFFGWNGDYVFNIVICCDFFFLSMLFVMMFLVEVDLKKLGKDCYNLL